jgi:hypothetical protein
MAHPLARLAASWLLAVVVLASRSAPAAAEVGTGAGPSAAPIVVTVPPAPRGEPKSERLALGLAVVGTAIPWAALTVALTSDDMDSDTYRTTMVLGTLGAWIGPSLGNLYAGGGHLRGFWLRTAGAGMMAVGAISTIDLDLCFGGDTGDGCDDEEDDHTFAKVMAGIGLGLVAWGTLDDIYSAAGHVAESNARRGFSVGVAPLVRSDGGGVTLAGRW